MSAGRHIGPMAKAQADRNKEDGVKPASRLPDQSSNHMPPAKKMGNPTENLEIGAKKEATPVLNKDGGREIVHSRRKSLPASGLNTPSQGRGKGGTSMPETGFSFPKVPDETKPYAWVWDPTGGTDGKGKAKWIELKDC